MIEVIEAFLANLFGDNAWLAVMVVAVLPMLELHSAIPFGMSAALLGENAMGAGEALFWGYLGSAILVPFFLLLAMPVLKWLKSTKIFKNTTEAFIEKVLKKKQGLQEKAESKKGGRASTFYKMLGIALFIALPIPFSGLYVASFVALFLGLGFWKSLISLLLGNLISGLLMVAICSIFINSVTVIFAIFFILMFILLIWSLIKFIIKPKRKKSLKYQA